MASIPGFVYILLGILMGGISWFLDYKTKSTSLTIFIIVGGIFIIVGIIKIAYKKKKQPTAAQQASQKKTHPQHVQQQALRQHSPQAQHQQAHQGQHSQITHPQQHQQVQHHPQHPAHPQQHVQHTGTHQTHPPIITCPHCFKRQYKTSNHCSHCKRYIG